MELEGIFVLTLFLSGFVSVVLVGMDSKDADFLAELSNKARQSPRAQFWDNLTARMRLISGIAAVVLLAAALVVNIYTWISSDIVQHRNSLIALDLGIAIVFFNFVVLERWKWRMSGSKKQAFTLPRWSTVVLAAVFIYIASVFAYDEWRSHRQHAIDTPANGKIHLEITAEERVQNQRRMVRGFSNIWVLLSSICAAGLLLVEHKQYEGPFGKFNRVVH